MKTQGIGLVVGLTMGLCTAATLAQPDTTMSYSIVWEKSQIAPGETNKGKVVCTIEPGLGTVVPWTTLPGKGQPGPIMAFASSIVDVVNTLNGKSGVLSWTIPAALNISSKPGMTNENGDIVSSCSGQVAPPLNPTPVLDNPITIIELAWKPPAAVPLPIDVSYFVSPASGKMFLNITDPINAWVGHNATFKVSAPPAGFTVIPAPSVATIGVIAIISQRRCRANAR